jgi:O-antigen ligase
VFGQIVTALYSCIATSIVGPGKVPEVFLGDVTHSGQLALVIPMFIGYFYRMVSDDHKNDSTKLFILLVASIATLSYLCLTKSCLLLITTLLLMCLLKPTRKIVGLSLLITCLIANLKRGPWLGVGCAVVYFLSVKRPKLVIPALLLIIALATTIPVVRNRIMDGQRDFNIAGGRATMWQIGAELVLQYPMGIGYGNSREMREFSFEIPAQHRHFHNNFLNILVETGWPGLLCFLAWIITIVSQINQNYGIFALALLSNQIAGLVEYNFGDSEIIIVLFICLGIFLSESHKQNNTSNHSQQR